MIKSHLLYQLSYAPGTGPESLRKRASFSKATPRCPANVRDIPWLFPLKIKEISLLWRPRPSRRLQSSAPAKPGCAKRPQCHGGGGAGLVHGPVEIGVNPRLANGVKRALFRRCRPSALLQCGSRLRQSGKGHHCHRRNNRHLRGLHRQADDHHVLVDPLAKAVKLVGLAKPHLLPTGAIST